jgi:hypothetical protein
MAHLRGNPAPWNYELEAIFQTGTFGNQAIRAWTLASNVTYTFTNAPLTPTLGLRLTAASGDNDPNDGILETFNPLFPNPTAVSPAAALSPTNLFEIHPSLELHPARNLTFNLDWNALWKLATRDAIYRPPGLAILTAGNSNQSWIGHQLIAQSQWQIDRHLSLVAVYVHFFSGSAITEAGGRDLDFVGSWLTYRF